MEASLPVEACGIAGESNASASRTLATIQKKVAFGARTESCAMSSATFEGI